MKSKYIVPVGEIAERLLVIHTISKLPFLDKDEILLVFRDPNLLTSYIAALKELEIQRVVIHVNDGATLYLQMLVAICKADAEEKNILFICSQTEYALVCWVMKNMSACYPDLGIQVQKIHDGTPFLESLLCRVKNFFVRRMGFRRFKSVWRT